MLRAALDDPHELRDGSRTHLVMRQCDGRQRRKQTCRDWVLIVESHD